MKEFDRPVSPCIQSALNTLSDEVTAWEFAKYLFGIHPEYVTDEIEEVFPKIDSDFSGTKKAMGEWLHAVEERYPGETLLHTGLVIIGLLHVDPELEQMIPKAALDSIEKRIRFKT